MNKTKITLMIGADNDTHKISDEYEQKIINILKEYWDDFTLVKQKGCYKGEIEESIAAIIFTLQIIFKDLDDCVEELKFKLEQETIGVQIEANVDFKLK